jgi:hypothetical protein
VPTAAERTGDFSGLTDPSTGKPTPLINEFASRSRSIRIPASLQSHIAQLAARQYPLPNIGADMFESTQLGSTNYGQGGFRLDHYFGAGDQVSEERHANCLHRFGGNVRHGTGGKQHTAIRKCQTAMPISAPSGIAALAGPTLMRRRRIDSLIAFRFPDGSILGPGQDRADRESHCVTRDSGPRSSEWQSATMPLQRRSAAPSRTLDAAFKSLRVGVQIRKSRR